MKRKALPLLLLLITASVFVQAQSTFMVRGGVNFANISIANNGSVDDAKQLTSYQVGVVGDFPLGTRVFSIQPGILFTGKGSKTLTGSESSSTYNRQSFNPKYIEVPVNLVFRIPLAKTSGVFVGAGPYAAVGITGKNKIEGKIAGVSYSGEQNIKFSNDNPTTTNTEEGAGYNIVRRFDYGANAIAGVEISNIVIGANYGLGLAKLQSGTNSSANENNKNRVFSLTLGFKF